MANNILIRDGNNVSAMVHSIEDGTSVHYHMTVLADTSGHLGVLVSGSQAATAAMHGFVVALHPSSPLPAGTQHLGKVSIAGTFPVSISDKVSVAGLVSAHQDGAWQVSIAPQVLQVSVADKVSVAGVVSAHQDGTWNINAVTSINSIVKVSIEGTLAVSVSDKVSVAGRVSVDNLVAVSINGPLPAGTQHLGKVSVEGLAVGGGLTVSVAGAASVQAVPIAGRDSSGNVRQPLLEIDGTSKVGGFTTNPEYVFTRPADTTAYTIGDLVANNTTAGSVTPMSFPVSRLTGGGGSFMVRRARLITPDDNRTTDRNYRLHIFNAASGVSVANGDNGVFAPTLVSVYCGYIDIPMLLSASTGAAGIGTGEINIQLAASQVSITTLLEARTSILPASGATYRTLLEIIHD